MRVAVISVHGCPVRQIGLGSAGGMNVFLFESMKIMSKFGVKVDLFTRHHDDSDPDIIKHNLRMSAQKEKVDFLDSVLRMISNRSFQLKGVIDWEKFKVGI